MTLSTSVQDVIGELARDPLRHIVLLKQAAAYPDHVKIHRVSDSAGAASLVLLETSASPYDRRAYPNAAVAAFISSDHSELTASLMPYVPRGVGIVFKLSRRADLAPLESKFAVSRRTAFVSFTSTDAFEPASDVRTTTRPGDDVLQLFEAQGHDRPWLQRVLRSGRAFACMLERGGDALSACLAFENYGPVWEVGGVVTAPLHRRQGLAARVVQTALARLSERALIPRYQVEENNAASIGLAESIGLAPFLTIVHYTHRC